MKKRQPQRKITLRDLTEVQFMEILKKACRPIGKSLPRLPKQVNSVDKTEIAEK